MWRSRLASLWPAERPFLVALGVAAVVRVLVMVAFPPAFVFSDGPTYLTLIDHLVPMANRSAGYGFLLRAIAWFSRDLWAMALVQHVLGLVIAVVIYALLRRRGVSPRVAMLATLPVLFDAMELTLEHSVLSDVLFVLLLVLAVAVLGWWRAPKVWTAALAGLLLGLAVCVRVVAEPVVLVAAVFCVVTAVGLRSRVLTALALCVAFAVPVGSYAAWYHHEHGIWGMTQSGGRALYMRTTTFVDCTKIVVPSYERQLCPEEPVGHRQDPTFYGWHDPDRNHALKPPPGVGINQAFRDFAIRAIEAQPWDYARTVARDVAMPFYFPARFDAFGYDTAHKWSFWYFRDFRPTDWNAPSYSRFGGQQPYVRQPLADALGIYGFAVITPGPVVLALLVLVGVGVLRRRPAADPALRPLALLATLIGLGLALAPDFTAEFTWRYQLPLVILLPIGAALAWTRLRQPGTTATPSTDCPNGGTQRRSTALVTGTTKRS